MTGGTVNIVNDSAWWIIHFHEVGLLRNHKSYIHSLYKIELTIQVIISIIMCGMKLLIDSQTSTVPFSAETRIPSSLQYKTHFSGQLNCWSLRCSWSIACRRCSNYIFILNLTPGFNGLCKDNYKMRREAFKFWDLVRLTLETLRLVNGNPISVPLNWIAVPQYGVRWTLNKNIKTLRPRQDGRHFPDDIFKCIFLNENL